jgi:hypothetical protein
MRNENKMPLIAENCHWWATLLPSMDYHYFSCISPEFPMQWVKMLGTGVLSIYIRIGMNVLTTSTGKNFLSVFTLHIVHLRETTCNDVYTTSVSVFRQIGKNYFSVPIKWNHWEVTQHREWLQKQKRYANTSRKWAAQRTTSDNYTLKGKSNKVKLSL